MISHQKQIVPVSEHSAARGAAPAFRAFELLGVPVALVTKQELLRKVDDCLSEGTKGWISYLNIHALNQASEFPWLRDYLGGSLLNYCDGVGVQLGARFLGGHIPERLTLPDFIDDLCAYAEQRDLRFFFLGSTGESLTSSVKTIRAKYPRLQISGYHHGYFDRTNGIDVVRLINNSRPHILFVGMGMPEQEEWVLRNFSSLQVNLIWMCGGLFELLSGNRTRAPRWMAQSGLEWLYRLLQEPRRLWKRYLIGNPMFMVRILKQRMRRGPRR